MRIPKFLYRQTTQGFVEDEEETNIFNVDVEGYSELDFGGEHTEHSGLNQTIIWTSSLSAFPVTT
jgi:hypothetical protein